LISNFRTLLDGNCWWNDKLWLLVCCKSQLGISDNINIIIYESNNFGTCYRRKFVHRIVLLNLQLYSRRLPLLLSLKFLTKKRLRIRNVRPLFLLNSMHMNLCHKMQNLTTLTNNFSSREDSVQAFSSHPAILRHL
jgi:hypothetical protein